MDGRKCETTRPLLSAFLDAALGAKEAEQVAAHLARCAACREYLAGLERVDRELEALPAPAPPRGYLQELRSRVAERIVIEPARKSGHGWLWPRLPSLAAAALVAVIIIKVIDLDPPGAVRSPRETLEGGELGGQDPKAEIAPPLIPPPQAHPLPLDLDRRAERLPAVEEAKEPVPAAPRAAAGAAGGLEKTAEKSTGKRQDQPASEVQEPTWGQIHVDGASEERRAENIMSEPSRATQIESGEAGIEIATLRRVERYFDAQRFDEGHALLDSLFALEESPAPAEAPPPAVPRLPFVADSARPEAAFDSYEQEAAFDRDPIRRLAAGYARVADHAPGTAAGAEAAARAAALAFQLHRQTGALADCEFARARIAALRERYPDDQRTDSLNALETTLPCAARD